MLLGVPAGEEDWNDCPAPSPPVCSNATRLQRAPEGLGLTLDCRPFLMRGVAYSPAPTGDDPGFGEPWGDYFTSEYASIFARDLTLVREMGANTLRLYSLKTSIRHQIFLDLCMHHQINVIVAFEMGSATQTPLATHNDLLMAKARLRRQIRASKHDAIILW